jgi:hypothetical protein
MKGLNHLQGRALLAVLFAAVMAGFASLAPAAGPPTVTVAVTGNPAPGATVTAKATVTINDGSTLQSITWTQVGGAKATLSNTTTDTITAVLSDRKTFRKALIDVLEEPPIATGQFPANVPIPNPYEGGLQDRFVVVGVAPLALEEAAAVKLDIAVVTSSGTYHTTTSIASKLPWTTATGNRNVPLFLPVLLHGKTQASYNWTLTGPTGSTAVLSDPTTQNPEFTPDIAGAYRLTVTNLATNAPVNLKVVAGTWKGIITGQDSNGRPVVNTECTNCHAGLIEMFKPWAKSGHAEIFTQNVNTPAGHYSTACLSCHTVGYNDPPLKNGGIADASDFQAFLGSGLLTHGDPLNWTKILAQFPVTARLANIQCETCHGPQTDDAHNQRDGARQTLSSDL